MKKQAKKKVVALIPPDVERCQAMNPNDCSFMSFGGVPKMVRCTNKPVTIATEVVPREDGLIGSMSLCNECWTKLIEQMGAFYSSFAPLPK